MSLNLAGLLVLLAGAPATVLFVYRYSTKSNWRQYPVGRALMYFAVSLGLTYIWIIVRLILSLAGHDTEALLFWQIVRLVLFAAISTTLWRLTYMLIKIQRQRGPNWVPQQASDHDITKGTP